MKKFLLIILLFSLTVYFISPTASLLFSPIFAQSTDELTKQLEEKQTEIAKLEAHLADARNQEKTLNSQVEIIDGQAKVTSLKIEETNLKIAKLEREISTLGERIERISSSLDTLSGILLKRIVQTYKYNSTSSTFDLIFSAGSISELLERLKYIQIVQAYDKQKLYELHATRTAYNEQKQDKETRQAEAERLNNELESYKIQLSRQKADKEELLRITKNDEARYQTEIARLQAELASIAQAISNVGAKIGPVLKGEFIAAMGSTGCSTGPHLHFEVFENAKVEGGKVLGSRVNPHNYLDSGKIGAPLQGYPGGNWVITTEYGEIYFLGTHTGLDIAPKGGGGLGSPIIAVESGIAYAISAPCNANIAGGSPIGKGVVVDHQNGIVTLYWHVL